MKASVVDLRYRMSEILKALDRNEDVSILCRGKLEELMDRLRGGRYRDI